MRIADTIIMSSDDPNDDRGIKQSSLRIGRDVIGLIS